MSLIYDTDGRPIHFPKGNSFEFDEEIATIFQDMAVRSIPGYASEKNLIATIINLHILKKLSIVGQLPLDTKLSIVDIGCSRGELFRVLVDSCLNHTLYGSPKLLDNMELIGIDDSFAMIEKAVKLDKYAMTNYIKANVLSMYRILPQYGDISCIVASYVVQFMEEEQRVDIYRRMFEGLQSGGILILSEKEADPSHKWWNTDDIRVAEYLRDAYIAFRKYNGYTDAEIKAKTAALAESMHTWPAADIVSALKFVGFKVVENIHRWGRFATYLAIK